MYSAAIDEPVTIHPLTKTGSEFLQRVQADPLSDSSSRVLAQRILALLMQYRRAHHHTNQVCGPDCSLCHSRHIEKIVSAIENQRPVTFVLPAFPGKSPNRAKVLSASPDLGEEMALGFLQGVCERIGEIYPSGAEIILCSDGRVFSDVVDMKEDDVTLYHRELSDMIKGIRAKNISIFSLDQVWSGGSFDFMRHQLMDQFAMPLDMLKARVREGASAEFKHENSGLFQMYLGLTRFLVEDATFPGQTKTRSAIQKECKERAYEVIRRSNAWSELLAQRFPHVVRLSIHPQGCGSEKLGIRFFGNETWTTPWHSVVVQSGSAFVLMKRSDAEALGAELVFNGEGRASHFILKSDASGSVDALFRKGII